MIYGQKELKEFVEKFHLLDSLDENQKSLIEYSEEENEKSNKCMNDFSDAINNGSDGVSGSITTAFEDRISELSRDLILGLLERKGATEMIREIIK
jgi:5'-3' exonuclease